THPALIEAMGAGNCALTLATPENMEVIGDAGIAYKSVEELSVYLQRVIDDPAIISDRRHRAMKRVNELYNWERITDQYEELLARLAGVEIPAGKPAPADPSHQIFGEQPPPKAKSAAENIP
ncbi:MAG TPA: glycosyltransferase, partial [Blastocatellia bacterium]